MSKLRPRFERLEPRILLSGVGLLSDGYDRAAPLATSSAAAAQSEETAAAEPVERAELAPSDPVVEPIALLPMTDRPAVETPAVDPPATPALGLPEVTQPAVPQQGSSLAAAESEPSDDLSPSTPATRTTVEPTAMDLGSVPASDVAPADGSTAASGDAEVVGSGRKLSAVAVEPRTVAEHPNVKPSAAPINRSADRLEQSARTDAGTSSQTEPGGDASSSGDGEDLAPATGPQAEGQSGAAATPAAQSAGASGEAVISLVGQSAGRREDIAAKTAAVQEAPPAPPAGPGSPCGPCTAEADQANRSEVVRSAATSPNAAAHEPQAMAGGTASAGIAEVGFAAGQRESDFHESTSQRHAPLQEALLAVTLGKPLSRLAGGGRGDDATSDTGSPSTRTSDAGSRRDRRRTGGSQGKRQPRKDTRSLTWFLPEDRPAPRQQAPTESQPEEAGSGRLTVANISPRLADQAILSCLIASPPEVPSGPLGSRWSELSWSDAWQGCELIAALAGGAALSGTISWLAVDRYRRAGERPAPVGFRPPAYTGRTLARAACS